MWRRVGDVCCCTPQRKAGIKKEALFFPGPIEATENRASVYKDQCAKDEISRCNVTQNYINQLEEEVQARRSQTEEWQSERLMMEEQIGRLRREVELKDNELQDHRQRCTCEGIAPQLQPRQTQEKAEVLRPEPLGPEALAVQGDAAAGAGQAVGGRRVTGEIRGRSPKQGGGRPQIGESGGAIKQLGFSGPARANSTTGGFSGPARANSTTGGTHTPAAISLDVEGKAPTPVTSPSGLLDIDTFLS
mmetsp:Transcript_50481/g.97518  ORF Transcript_50481/g.97518 Transcript_50481/m.97518 type:complete len:247 (-) Transcript_50481:59-799(-)